VPDKYVLRHMSSTHDTEANRETLEVDILMDSIEGRKEVELQDRRQQHGSQSASDEREMSQWTDEVTAMR